MKKVIIFTLAIVGLTSTNSCKKEKTTPKPTADFSYTGGGCTAPCAVLFENKSKAAISYSWDFGDGTTSTEANPTKTYNVGGTYTVVLTANGEGGSASISKQVLIQKSKPTADFSYTGGGCTAPCAVLFENKSTNATSYKWDFGDGTTSEENNPTKTYNVGATYMVTLTATGEGGSASTSKQILIQKSAQSQLPSANFTFSGGGCTAPCNVVFTNTSSNATSYNWDFGDGTKSVDPNPTKRYTAGGSYSVILTATNAAGNNQITKIINVVPAPTKVQITKVTITNMPFVDGNGTGWDPSNGPDVFFDIIDQQRNIFVKGTDFRINDVTPSMMPISWSFTTPFEITDFSAARYIDIWDYDTFDPDDYIGYVGFIMSNYTIGSNPYPSSVTETTNGITVKLDLIWQ